MAERRARLGPVVADLDAVLNAALHLGGDDVDARELAALLRHLEVLAESR